MTDQEILDDEDDSEPPWASPEIQHDYEVALGRFMVAFNKMDHLLTEILKRTLQRMGRKDLIKKCAESTALKVTVLGPVEVVCRRARNRQRSPRRDQTNQYGAKYAGSWPL
jgi:hypothetical protein